MQSLTSRRAERVPQKQRQRGVAAAPPAAQPLSIWSCPTELGPLGLRPPLQPRPPLQLRPRRHDAQRPARTGRGSTAERPSGASEHCQPVGTQASGCQPGTACHHSAHLWSLSGPLRGTRSHSSGAQRPLGSSQPAPAQQQASSCLVACCEPRGHPVHTGGNSSGAAVSGRGTAERAPEGVGGAAHTDGREEPTAAQRRPVRRDASERAARKFGHHQGAGLRETAKSACRLTGAAPQKTPRLDRPSNRDPNS